MERSGTDSGEKATIGASRSYPAGHVCGLCSGAPGYRRRTCPAHVHAPPSSYLRNVPSRCAPLPLHTAARACEGGTWSCTAGERYGEAHSATLHGGGERAGGTRRGGGLRGGVWDQGASYPGGGTPRAAGKGLGRGGDNRLAAVL